MGIEKSYSSSFILSLRIPNDLPNALISPNSESNNSSSAKLKE